MLLWSRMGGNWQMIKENIRSILFGQFVFFQFILFVSKFTDVSNRWVSQHPGLAGVVLFCVQNDNFDIHIGAFASFCGSVLMLFIFLFIFLQVTLTLSESSYLVIFSAEQSRKFSLPLFIAVSIILFSLHLSPRFSHRSAELHVHSSWNAFQQSWKKKASSSLATHWPPYALLPHCIADLRNIF